MNINTLIQKVSGGSLVKQIAVGIVAGVILAQVWPQGASASMLLGTLFVQALKAVAPVLVLVLVASALANNGAGSGANLRPIIGLYLVATFSEPVLAGTHPIRELQGRVFGIVGYGALGRAVTRVAESFGMTVIEALSKGVPVITSTRGAPADILRVPVERPRVTETTALGAAFLAGLATGFWSSTEEVAASWRLDRRFEPQMDRAERDRLLQRWRRAVERTKGWATD